MIVYLIDCSFPIGSFVYMVERTNADNVTLGTNITIEIPGGVRTIISRSTVKEVQDAMKEAQLPPKAPSRPPEHAHNGTR